MPLHNSELADEFRQMADLLDIKGANQFRIRAYRNAARTVADLSENITDLVKEDKDLTELEGIGKDLSGKIKEMVEKGYIEELNELEEEIPVQLTEMLKLPGLGPERVKTIYNELGLENIDDLERAARNGKIQELSGLGEKTEQQILTEIKKLKEDGSRERILIRRAEEIVEPLIEYLKKCPELQEIEVAGSYRRRKETVGDLDLVACGSDGESIISYFTTYEDVARIISSGETRSSVILNDDIQVDLRVIGLESYGAALHYLTGSKEHSVKLRKMGQEKGLKINEYGVFKGDDKIGGSEEGEIYASLDLPYIEPELREKRGELDIKEESGLPNLIELADIKGDLQMHTDSTDGRSTMEEMVEAAIEKGYHYIAITDHSKRVSMARGLDEERLKEQIARIDKLNEDYHEIEILKSIEVDILKDGSLDLADEVLEKLDLRVCSIHYQQNLPMEEQTERLIRAMKNPLCNIIAHPTGRKIGKREPMGLDLDKVMETALENNCILEINASPERLDLSDRYIKKAVEMGVQLVISTDAHTTNGLDNMKYGVYQARRGWCEAADVINTRDIKGLKDLLKKREE